MLSCNLFALAEGFVVVAVDFARQGLLGSWALDDAVDDFDSYMLHFILEKVTKELPHDSSEFGCTRDKLCAESQRAEHQRAHAVNLSCTCYAEVRNRQDA